MYVSERAIFFNNDTKRYIINIIIIGIFYRTIILFNSPKNFSKTIIILSQAPEATRIDIWMEEI